MSELFLKILNMSISAGWVVLAVVVLRLILKKAPKWVNVLLWGMVAVRLIFPVSLESVFSLIPSAETIPEEVISGPSFGVQTGVSVVDNQINHYLDDRYFEGVTVPANHGFHVMTVLSVIWLLGMAGMLAYTFISYLRLRRKVETAVLLRDNVFQSEAVGSPFVLGIIKPRIYLLFQIEAADLEHVVAHEQAHIYRKDHWWKPLGFLLLTIHWFNPLLWLAYVLLCRDIELACDEKVIKNLNKEEKADYSQALLACSVNSSIHHRMISACPLAFGEVGVKERVKSVLNYKKPGFWVMLLAVVACVVVAVCFLTNPKENLQHAPEPFCHSYRVSEVLYSDPQISYNYGNHAPRYQFTSDYGMFETENVLTDGEIVDGWAQRQGAFKEFKITSENFDYYFVSGGDGTRADWSELRADIKKAWKLDVEKSGKSLFFYLIYTKEKEVYLALGGNVGDTTQTGLKTRIDWLFKLERTDILSVNAVSEGCDAYVEPAYFPENFDWNYSKLPSGTINKTGKLVFKTSLDVDILTVSEDYYRKNGNSTEVERKTYELNPVSKGNFELQVALRGEQTEEAFYFIRANEGVYVFKIVFGTESAELINASGKVTKWFDYTENPSEMDWDNEITTTHPDFPGVTFHYTPYDISVTKESGIFGKSEREKLIDGWPIWNAYFYDVTGDGISDVCASLSIGFGAIDNRIIVYDYAEGASYSLVNRMEYDYYLRYNKEDDLLYVDKKVYNSNEVVQSGPLVFQDECIQILFQPVTDSEAMLVAQVSCKTESGNPWSIEVKLASEDLGETWTMIKSWASLD